MPRNRRGGPRAGRPGAAYSNRQDLQVAPRTAGQAPRAATGQQYGQAKAQLDAQEAIPLPTAPALAPVPPLTPGPAAGGLGPFDRPTERPDEPVTAGAPLGPGVGPQALNLPDADQSVLDQLRGVLAAHPTPELASLIDQMQAEGIL